MVPLKLGTFSLGWWSVVYCGGPKMIVSLSFSPAWPAVDRDCAMLWCSSCSSWARPASKSDTVICGVDDGSDPFPVACGLLTVRQGLKGLFSMTLMVFEPTLPAEAGWTATTSTTPLTAP